MTICILIPCYVYGTSPSLSLISVLSLFCQWAPPITLVISCLLPRPNVILVLFFFVVMTTSRTKSEVLRVVLVSRKERTLRTNVPTLRGRIEVHNFIIISESYELYSTQRQEMLVSSGYVIYLIILLIH